MKQQQLAERTICDFCKTNEASYSSCLGCGKDICYDCKKIHAKEYTHGVHVGGSGDGVYCNVCDERLRITREPKHTAYLAIKSLKDEARGFYDDFEIRRRSAEDTLKRLQAGKPEVQK